MQISIKGEFKVDTVKDMIFIAIASVAHENVLALLCGLLLLTSSAWLVRYISFSAMIIRFARVFSLDH